MLLILEFLHSFSGSSTVFPLLTGSEPGRSSSSPSALYSSSRHFSHHVAAVWSSGRHFLQRSQFCTAAAAPAANWKHIFFFFPSSKWTNLSAERRGRSEPETRRHICVLFQLTLHPPSCGGNLFSETFSFGATNSRLATLNSQKATHSSRPSNLGSLLKCAYGSQLTSHYSQLFSTVSSQLLTQGFKWFRTHNSWVGYELTTHRSQLTT